MKNLTATHDQKIKTVVEKKQRTFVERNSLIAEVTQYMLLPAVSLISAFTAYPAVYAFIFNQYGNEKAALIVAVFVGLVLEITKWVIVPQALDDYADKVYNNGTAEKSVFWVKVIMATAVMAASVSLSLVGASDSAKLWKDSTKPLELYTTDAVNARYDALTAAEDATAATAPTWRGVLTKKGTQIVQKSQDNKAQYEASRQNELAKIDAENTRLRDEYDADLMNSGSKFTAMAGIGELLFLLLCLFLVKFENALIEAEANRSQVPNHPPTLPTTPAPNGNGKHTMTLSKNYVPLNVGNTGHTGGNTGLNSTDYVICHPESGLPYVRYKGAKRSREWIIQQIKTADSKLRKNEDNPETVQARKDFYLNMLQRLTTAEAA